MSPALALGALYCALAVAAGAFGAHALEARLDPRALGQWETAARYLMIGGLGLCVTGLFGVARGAPVPVAVWGLAAGSALFSATVMSLALGGPRWLGAITPLGGAAMIAGFLALAWASWRG